MARQRKTVSISTKSDASHTPRNGNSSSSQGSATPQNRPPNQSSSPTSSSPLRHIYMTQWRILFGCCCLAIASYFGYLGYLETRVNTPFDDQKVYQKSHMRKYFLTIY